MLNNFLHENKLIFLNTKFQKRPGQTWTHTSPNMFEVATSNIQTSNIKLSLRNNIKKVSKTKLYDLSTLKYDTKIKNTIITEVKINIQL